MMGANTAMRIAGTASAGKASAEAPAGEDGGFPAALTAAVSGHHASPGKGTAAAGATSGDAGRDVRAEASDPALAAALAALFPGALPASDSQASGGDEGAQVLAFDAMGRPRAGLAGSPADETLDAQLDDALDAHLATPGDEPAAEMADDLLQNLARELAMARESAAPLRAGTELRAPGIAEPLPASVSTHAATQLAGIHATTATAVAADQVLRHPVSSPRWAEELGSRLVQMSTRGQNEGSLTLAPEHLGPLEVRISMNQGTANVWFGAHHADTRAALADALPRLREMLADAGLSLGHAGVSHEAPGRNPEQDLPLQQRLDAEAAATPVQSVSQGVRRAVSGLLDLYA